MLDECKGEKFEEMITVFSVLVLKKVKGTAHMSFDPITIHSAHVVPLIISHRKGIQRDLEKRKELVLKAERQKQSLRRAVEALTAEEAELERKKIPKIPENADTLRKIVRENWMGDNGWVDTILHGIPPSQSYSHGWKQDEALLEHEYDEDSASELLVDLTARARTQSMQLAHWQKCLQDLRQRREPDVVHNFTRPKESRSKTPLFSRHQNLDGKMEHETGHEFSLEARHAALVTSLEQELARPKHRPPPVDPQKQSRNFARTGSNHLSQSRMSVLRTQTSPVRPHQRIDEVDDETPSVQHTAQTSVASQNAKDDGIKPSRFAHDIGQRTNPATPPEPTVDSLSLTERTRASLAQYETPRAQVPRSKKPTSLDDDDLSHTVIAPPLQPQSDRSSLLERTRQSMSLLANALEDNSQSGKKSKTYKPLHSKSKSVNLPSNRRKLERAWSEESLASVSAKDDFDVEADYESVFKSRPKLAMSPDLSPQRNDLFDDFLEESMKKLSINSTPKY